MRRVSKTGRAYTEGSHSTWSGYPRDCAGCGVRLRITKDKLWLETIKGVKRSWHIECRLEVSR